jgi:hypothetical protein
MICVVSQGTQLPRDDDERRLLTAFEAGSAKQSAPFNRLSNPRRSMLYPVYLRLMDLLTAIGLKCDETMIALRAYRKKT